jgi:hypothetical protein
MTNRSDENPRHTCSQEVKELLGPVLQTESAKDYEEMYLRLAQCLGPDDYLQRIFVADVARATWDMVRYTKYMSLSVERRVQQFRKNEARRAEAKKKQAAAKHAAPRTELDRVCEVMDVFDATVEDVDAILNGPPEDLEYARALEHGLESYQRLEQMLDRAVRRRNNALNQLALYRESSARRMRHISDAIIADAASDSAPEPSEEAAPLAPKGGEVQ